MTNLKNRSIAGLGAMIATVLSFTAVSPLHAETVVPVSYADLDVHSVRGATELNSRLRDAAKLVCGHGEAAIAQVQCRQQVVSAAKAKMASVSIETVQLALR
jgi:UrcA family protein